MRSTLERTGCSPWKLSGALTNPPKKREKKQVQINKSRCFQRAPIHSSPETEAKKASAIATIKQPCTTPRQRKAEIPCQHHPTHTKANAPGKSSLSGTINTGCRQTTGTRISPCQPGRCPPDHPPTPPPRFPRGFSRCFPGETRQCPPSPAPPPTASPKGPPQNAGPSGGSLRAAAVSSSSSPRVGLRPGSRRPRPGGKPRARRPAPPAAAPAGGEGPQAHKQRAESR